MAENIGTVLPRDTALEQRLLEAVVADRNAQPRSQQLQVGPSQVGGCRELLRAGLFEQGTLAEPETTWATAAHVGQVMGESLEGIFGERLDALTQQRITAMFGMLGVNISGAVDLMFMAEDQISDLKSCDDMGSVLYDQSRNRSLIDTLLEIRREGLLFQKKIETPDGGYELTEVLVSKIAKLHYFVQVAIYVMGAMQAGILTPDATGRLVFYDRSGNYQGFVALIISTEEIALFYDIAQMRLTDVVHAQMAYEGTNGNPAVIAHLRDMTPSFCFSPKVMCPRRMHCWAGSDWANDNQITNPDHVAATNRYVVGRDLAKLGDAMKRAAKADLDGVNGMLPDGKMVTHTQSGAINVVETTVREPQTQARLDEYVPPVDVIGEAMAEQERKAAGIDDAAVANRAMRERDLGKMQKPELVALCNAAGLEPKGVKATLIARILDHEAEHGEIQIIEPEGGGTLVVPSDIAPSPQDEVASAAFVEEVAKAAQQTEWQGELTTYTEMVGPEMAEATAEQRALIETAMQGGPEGDEAADQLQQSERDPRTERVHFVDTDPRPMEEENVLLPGDQGMPYTKAPIEQAPRFEGEPAAPEWSAPPQHPESKRLETQNAGYETAEVLQFRQKLFGLTPPELENEAISRRINPFQQNRNAVIQHIIDHDYPPIPGRGWMPNGAGTSGDPTTDRLRQMQYDADPAMRRNYEQEN